MSCDTSGLTFDISGSAALFSQLAGVLAAFAFGAIALVLPGEHRGADRRSDTPDSRRERADVHLLLALVATFVSLIIATMQFAALAGERGCALYQGRAAAEEFLGGVAFAFAVVMLMYAIVQLVALSRIAAIGVHARLIVVVLGPALATLFMLSGAEDVASAPWRQIEAGQLLVAQNTAFHRQISTVALLLPAGQLAVSLLAWSFRRRLGRWLPSSFWPLAPVLFPYLSLGLATAAIVRSMTLIASVPTTSLPPWEVLSWLAVCSLVLLCQVIVLAVGPPRRGRR
ncbi:hypothetical protein F0L68_14755 [Solihabitans fulvus]|uniref:Uncharacterized protein n=1 Tax=Solihabitans fulvus TaxID=1892852 RepID=A0A5B2XDY4_9PSEU|nr:hypothetical protein [Solihabitans fulvus]KAA2261958.1 hypothetical protein F0L68_14755 [Solihabitans fulvus]